MHRMDVRCIFYADGLISIGSIEIMNKIISIKEWI